MPAATLLRGAREAAASEALGVWRSLTIPHEGFERPPWRVRDAAFAIAGVILTAVGLIAARRAFIGEIAAADKPAVSAIAILLVFSLSAIPVWYFVFRRRGGNWRAAGARRPLEPWGRCLQRIAIAYPCAVFAAVVMLLAIDALGITPLMAPEDGDREKRLIGSGIWMLLNIAIVVGLVPFVEELLCRGILLSALTRAMPVGYALLTSAVVFSAAHLNPATYFPFIAIGVALGWLYIRTGSIWPGTIYHGFHNGVALTSQHFL